MYARVCTWACVSVFLRECESKYVCALCASVCDALTRACVCVCVCVHILESD